MSDTPPLEGRLDPAQQSDHEATSRALDIIADLLIETAKDENHKKAVQLMKLGKNISDAAVEVVKRYADLANPVSLDQMTAAHDTLTFVLARLNGLLDVDLGQPDQPTD